MKADPTLVLMPGLDGTGKLFQPLVGSLPASIRCSVAAYPTDHKLSIRQMARRVAATLPPGPLVLLAESFSGLVALALLHQRVASIRAVIFCAAFAGPPRPLLLGAASRVPASGRLMQAAPSVMVRALGIGWQTGRERLALLRSALVAVAPEVLAHRLRLIASARPPDQARYALPCYYLQPGQDRLVPRQAARWFERRFNPFRLERVDGPHLLLLARPRACARRIAAIWRQIQGQCA
jgi:pimeloyl-[acyl-carrier protein] methyl ester esterase